MNNNTKDIPRYLKPWSTIEDNELKILRNIAEALRKGDINAALDLAIQHGVHGINK